MRTMSVSNATTVLYYTVILSYSKIIQYSNQRLKEEYFLVLCPCHEILLTVLLLLFTIKTTEKWLKHDMFTFL